VRAQKEVSCSTKKKKEWGKEEDDMMPALCFYIETLFLLLGNNQLEVKQAN
jgi:hypothetical protein